MQKIPTVFVRDEADRKYVTEAVNPGCEWVLDGQGEATRKYDGTCVMLDDAGAWWARREVKPGKAAPANYVPAAHDDVTGKTVGWEPIAQSGFARPHTEALQTLTAGNYAGGPPPGTYELVGPKIGGNPEGRPGHTLVWHAAAGAAPDTLPRTFASIRADVLALGTGYGSEGIVYHHPDGRMAKVKVRDFRG